MSPVDAEQFRLEDYKLKLAYLDAHSNRMWTRFNYFVTIEAALVGFFTIAASDQFQQRAPWAALIESILSLSWWAVGARDRFLWRAGRRNVEHAAEKLRVSGHRLVIYKDSPSDGYVPVGELDPFGAQMRDEAYDRYGEKDIRARLGAWAGTRNTRLGVTVIPMLIPAIATPLWWLLFLGLLAGAHGAIYLLIGLAPLVGFEGSDERSSSRHGTQAAYLPKPEPVGGS
jgi:hypothetical protein